MRSSRDYRAERRKEIIEVWKTIVGVQQHFNDISMRIRSLLVTVLLALLASIGFLLDKKLGIELWGWRIEFAAIVPVFGIFGTWLFYFIDRYWYHRLLVGSVKHAIAIENKYSKELPELSLSDAIGKESPYRPEGLSRLAANLFVGDKKYRETGALHSDGKIELFYKSVCVALLFIAIVMGLLGNYVAKEDNVPNTHEPSRPAARTTTIIAPLPTFVSMPLPSMESPSPAKGLKR